MRSIPPKLMLSFWLVGLFVMGWVVSGFSQIGYIGIWPAHPDAITPVEACFGAYSSYYPKVNFHTAMYGNLIVISGSVWPAPSIFYGDTPPPQPRPVQYVWQNTVPLGTLAPGNYALVVQIWDLGKNKWSVNGKLAFQVEHVMLKAPPKIPPSGWLPDLRWEPQPPPDTWQPSGYSFELPGVLKNGGDLPVEGEYSLAYYLDDELVYTEPGPMLEPGEEAEIAFAYDITPGVHELVVVADVEGQIEELNEDNNTFSLLLSVFAGEGAAELSEEPQFEVEAIPVCAPGISHQLQVRWSTPGFDQPVLEIAFPNGKQVSYELSGPVGETIVPIDLPEGGNLTVTIHLEAPGRSSSISGSVSIPPC